MFLVRVSEPQRERVSDGVEEYLYLRFHALAFHYTGHCSSFHAISQNIHS